MKKIRKLLSIFFLMILTFALVSCGNTGGGEDKKDPERKVYLTYAEWGDQTVANSMIQAFMAKHPNIIVTLDTSITGSGVDFTNNLIAAAQANLLPDVFVTDNVPSVIENNLVRDVSEYWNKDDDAKLVYSNIADTAVYRNASTNQEVRLAVPSYQFIKGFFVNKTLLTNLGIDIPGYDWTFDEFYDICQQVKNAGSYGGHDIYAINGYYGALDFEKAMTAQDGAGLGYDSWNGSAFNYSSESWLKYRRYTETFYSTGLLEQLTADEKNQIYGSPEAWPFAKGHTAFAVEGSWNIIDYLDQFKESGMDVEFYPYPAGEVASEAVILDYMCVSSLTEFPEEAYELLKWMSFGRDGWGARLNILKQSKKGLDRYPVAAYDDIWAEIDTYMEEVSAEHNYAGLDYCIEHLNAGSPDVDKWLPGYSAFWNYVSETEEEQDWYNKDTDQLAREWTALLNQYVKDAYAKLGLKPYKD
jgi:multiple sugar transport system substrate-binding protein